MSIQNYSNRNKYKNKSAIEIVFKKSSDFQIPKGYTSMDICLVGGGAAGFGSPIFNTSSNNSEHGIGSKSYGRMYFGLGGCGGYVKNLYNKKIDAKNIYVEIGNGGIGNDYSTPYIYMNSHKVSKYYDPNTGKQINNYYIFDSCDYRIIFGGGKTFIKDKDTNKILFECPGAQGWRNRQINREFGGDGGYMKTETYPDISTFGGRDSIKQVLTCGGGNLGGGSLELQITYGTQLKAVNTPYSIYSNNRYTHPTIYPYGTIKGEPSLVNFDSLYETDYYAITASAGSPGEKKTFEILVAGGNKAITEEGYGDTRIFDGSSKIFDGKGYCEGDWVAGGGCVGWCGNEIKGYNVITNVYGQTIVKTISPTIVKDEKTYTLINTDGGGNSGIAKCANISNGSDGTYSNLLYELLTAPGNGKPNTGGGGAGGMFYCTTNDSYYISGGDNNRNSIVRKLSPPGNGGSGICVIRLYSDENRPKVTFVEGINRTIIE